MSKIQGKPFIQKVVETLTEEQTTALLGLVNGSDSTPAFRSLINPNSHITDADKNQVQYIILEAWDKTYTGYLVYNTTYCVLVAYTPNTQELTIVNINLTNQTYKLVREPLSILELRFVLSGEGSGGGGSEPEILEVSNITALTDEQIDGLKAGDVVVKKTGDMRHSYRVSYKENNTGICLTYVDASVSETVSYDYTGGHWVYNSTDVTELGADGTVEVVELTGLSGTLSDSDYTKITNANTVIKLGTQTYYKEFDASTLITYQAFSRVGGTAHPLYEFIEVTKADKTWELKVQNIIEVNPTVPEGTTPTSMTGLKVGDEYFEVQSGGGGSTPDADVTVEIESNYSSTDYANRTSYATAISLQEFIANCEAGNVYTNAGIIAKINNLISGKAFRVILIGTNHEVLAYDDTTQAKTTWQFLDMPEHNVRLGLPINLLDMGSTDSRAKLNEFLDASNSSSITVYPSNMDGLISAQGLLQANMTIYEELPETLKRHIKTVRRYYYRKRNTFTIAASGEGAPGSQSNSGQMCQLAQNVFHLAGTDLGTSGQSGEGSGSVYTYLNTGAANRIRFYNGTAASYWNASPFTSGSFNWYSIDHYGIYDNYITYSSNGVAPAFCI